MKPRARIFICYRRDDGADLARLVHDNLQKRGFDVFMDVEDLKSGQFNKSLLLEIESATDVVVILSPRSLDRCFEEGDWLRWEVAHAIKCEKNIVPLAARGFMWPTQPLPEDLKDLPYYQGVEPSHSLFVASMDKLEVLLQGRPALHTSRRHRWFALAALVLFVALSAWYFGAQHGRESTLGDENVREKTDRNGWIKLFDGKTLSGWTSPDEGDWTMSDGVLTGRGKTSHLFSPFIYTNLEFKAEIKLNHGGNGGMLVRATLGKGVVNGYQVKANNTSPDKRLTGSLMAGIVLLSQVSEQLVPDDTWWTQHIVVVGDRIIIKVNDKIVTDYVDQINPYTSGRLALRQFQFPKAPGGIFKYRNIMAKRLPNDAKEAWAIARKDMPDIRMDASGTTP